MLTWISQNFVFMAYANQKLFRKNLGGGRLRRINAMDENSSFIFTCHVKTVLDYDFKLVCVVLYPSVKEV